MHVGSVERNKLIDEDNKQKFIFYAVTLERIHHITKEPQQLWIKYIAALDHNKHVAATSHLDKQELQNQFELLQGQYVAAQDEHNQLDAASKELIRQLQHNYDLLQIPHAKTIQRN